ncbi:hypothetical protein GPOL_c49260 [Gordonia polyisoprenivorans VH2]|uniref:Uncharacterized protein n=1 Tax=Gordonia polyisoprenivorans (strain DSM 44266 / VH2) TaxID=1112204 RepID=H6N248_GORPV|nr:hypothetical protein GPOL_c49260 [Gordonia polyisoprenivorans VH2]
MLGAVVPTEGDDVAELDAVSFIAFAPGEVTVTGFPGAAQPAMAATATTDAPSARRPRRMGRLCRIVPTVLLTAGGDPGHRCSTGNTRDRIVLAIDPPDDLAETVPTS